MRNIAQCKPEVTNYMTVVLNRCIVIYIIDYSVNPTSCLLIAAGALHDKHPVYWQGRCVYKQNKNIPDVAGVQSRCTDKWGRGVFKGGGAMIFNH